MEVVSAVTIAVRGEWVDGEDVRWFDSKES